VARASRSRVGRKDRKRPRNPVDRNSTAPVAVIVK